MQRLFTPWVVLPLFFGGLLLTWLISQSIRVDAEQAWQQRVSLASQGYSEIMMAPVDMNAALLSAIGGLLISSDSVKQHELDRLLNYLQMPHLNSAGGIHFKALQYRDGRWQTLLTAGDSRLTEPQTSVAAALLQQCSADKHIKLLSGTAKRLLMCGGIPDQPMPLVLILEFPVQALLSSATVNADMHLQLSLSPQLNPQQILLTEALTERPDRYRYSFTSDRYASRWQFDWQAEPQAFGGADYRLANTIIVGGIVMTLLISELLLILLSKLQQDRRQASVRNEFARRMEQERDRAQLYLDTAQVVLIALDLNGQITLVNRKTIDSLGYDEAELVGRNIREFLLDEEREMINQRMNQSMLDGNISGGENRLRTKPGALRWFQWRNTPLLDEQGAPKGMLCSGEDITERRRMENALRELATSLSRIDGDEFFNGACRYLTEQLQIDIAFVGTFDQASGSIRCLTGVDRQQAMPPFSYTLAGTPCANVMQRDICVYPTDVAKLFPDDLLLQEMHIESYLGAALHDLNRQPFGILILAHRQPLADVVFSELLLKTFVPRIESELERQCNQEKLQLAQRMFETSNDGFFILDADSICREVNQTMVKISGYSRSELLGQRISQLLTNNQEQFVAIREQVSRNNYWSGELSGRRKNGEVFNFWLRINTMRNSDNEVTHIFGSMTDITQEKNNEQLLDKLAFYDHLTGLPNRGLIRERLQEQIRLCRNEQRRLAVLQIDLDNFKLVNETLGYASGDMLVIEAGRRLQAILNDTATLGRVGGDDFTIILPSIQTSMEAAQLAEQLMTAMQKSYTFDNQSVYIGCTMGIAVFPEDGDNSDALLKAAETALYRAKEQERGNFNFFTQDMNARNALRLTMEHELRHAIDNGELQAWYQPKYCLNSDAIVGFEALLRWQHPERGMIPPLDFIPLAEETGLIIPIGVQVLQQACAQLKRWHTLGHKDLQMAVNLSPKQFQDKNLLVSIASIINAEALPSGCIELEITESAAMAEPEQAITIMKQLRAIGVTISIDDFGTGYSSLSYLKRFPLNTLKIDQSFVRHLTEESDDAAIVASVISLAKVLNLEVVAEGVETSEQLNYLRSQGCDLVQGYLLSKPLPAAQIELLLDKPLLITAR